MKCFVEIGVEKVFLSFLRATIFPDLLTACYIPIDVQFPLRSENSQTLVL